MVWPYDYLEWCDIIIIQSGVALSLFRVVWPVDYLEWCGLMIIQSGVTL